MKQIYFSDHKSFTLTDKEFEEAKKCWNKKEPYCCQRLKNVLITRQFKWVDTPDDDKDGDGNFDQIFVRVRNGKIIQKIWQHGDTYYLKAMVGVDDSEGRFWPINEFYKPDQLQELLKELVEQEEYYDNQIKQLSNGPSTQYLSQSKK